jgi:hypothetical protein
MVFCWEKQFLHIINRTHCDFGRMPIAGISRKIHCINTFSHQKSNYDNQIWVSTISVGDLLHCEVSSPSPLQTFRYVPPRIAKRGRWRRLVWHVWRSCQSKMILHWSQTMRTSASIARHIKYRITLNTSVRNHRKKRSCLEDFRRDVPDSEAAFPKWTPGKWEFCFRLACQLSIECHWILTWQLGPYQLPMRSWSISDQKSNFQWELGPYLVKDHPFRLQRYLIRSKNPAKQDPQETFPSFYESSISTFSFQHRKF